MPCERCWRPEEQSVEVAGELALEASDRGHGKLPTGGQIILHPSGSGSTVRCSCTLDCREDAHEERKDTGGDHRVV
jgi:hypothetical protein